MVRKAQMELFVLLGLIFVGVTVIYLAYQGMTFETPSAPIGIGEEKKAISEPVEMIFHTAAEEALKTIEFQGGYSNYGAILGGVTESVPTTKYLGANVRYWSMCNMELMPDLEEEVYPIIERYIERYIQERIEGTLGLSYRTVEVELDELEVEISLTDNNMMTKIFLPIRIENYTLYPNYVINIPTKFREIFRFAEDFSKDQVQNRHLETFTLASLLYSPDLPVHGMLTECGEFIIATQYTIKEGIENAVFYTLANLHFWTTLSQHEVSHDQNKYYIESVQGNSYPHLETRISLSDDADFTTYADPIILLNIDWLSDTFPFIIPKCLSQYSYYYSIMYPYVITVKDSLLNTYFNFAGIVYVGVDATIPAMVPAECGDAVSIQLELDDWVDICECAVPNYATINIDSIDGPVSGADILYGKSCLLKETETPGEYKGEIACTMEDEIIISHEDYNFIKEHIPSDQLDGKTYYIPKVPNVKYIFYEVGLYNYTLELTPQMLDGDFCTITNSLTSGFQCEIKPITSHMINGYLVADRTWPIIPNMNPEANENCVNDDDVEELQDDLKDCECSWFARIFGCNDERCMLNVVEDYMNDLGDCIISNDGILQSVEMDYIPGHTEYTFDLSAINIHGFKVNGGLSASHTLNEEDHELHVYIPIVSTKRDIIEDDEQACLTDFIVNQCRIIDPVSESPASYNDKPITRVIRPKAGECCLTLKKEIGSDFETWSVQTPEGCEGDDCTGIRLECSIGSGVQTLLNSEVAVIGCD